MRDTRRTTALVAVAALAPLVALAFLLVAGSLRNARVQIEQQTLARAAVINAKIDAELMIDLGSLQVLSGSSFISKRDWVGARQKAAEVQQVRGEWRNVVLTEIASSKVVWETAQSSAKSGAAPASVLEFLKSGTSAGLTGPEPVTDDCRCITMHQIVVVGADRFLLSVERDVRSFQAILTNEVSAPEVGAIVDRHGLFIARTLDIESRFGTPATEYVRSAVTRGGSGIYEGVTYEDLKNRTGYTTSDFSGWSTHVAIPSGQIEVLGVGSVGTAVSSVLIAFVFASGIVIFALREAVERRLAQRAWLQTQKLSAVGHLSSVVAHDFNNLLAVMLSSFKILEREPLSDRQKLVIAEARKTANRSTELIQQLLGFVRDKPIELACVDLGASVLGCESLLNKALGGSVSLEINLAANEWHALTNQSQLEIALLNLATNARDAMPNGGRLEISARKSRKRGFIILIVRDDGPGMTGEIAAQAMDAYYTTKPEGKGTGLGLAQVQMLATQSGGSLELETSPGKGAEFKLRFRSCEPSASV